MSNAFDRIVMEGEYVSFQRIEESFAKVDDLASYLGMSATIAVGPLPYGCKFVTKSADQNTIWYIVERPPAVVPVGFQFADIIVPDDDPSDYSYFRGSIRGCEEKKEVFELAIPFNYYIFKFFNNTMERMFTAWKKKPLTSLSDRLYWAGMPNIYVDFKVCMGGTFSASASDPVDVQVDKAIEAFWTTAFNRDLTETFMPYLNYFGNLQTWEDESLNKDPLEVWKSHRLHHHRTAERIVGLA